MEFWQCRNEQIVRLNIICFVAKIAIIKIVYFKMSFLDRLYFLAMTLNMNEYDNEEKLYGISTNFIRKLKCFFFKILEKKDEQIFPWTRCIPFKLVKNWHVCMDPFTYNWMTTAHTLIKNLTFCRQTLTKFCDVLMDIQIMLQKIYWLIGFQKIV